MTVTLLQGDCLELLPGIPPVDAVITDPVWPNAPAGMFDVDDPARLLRSALDLITARCVIIVLRYDSDPRFLASIPDKWPFFRLQTLEYSVPGYNGRKLGGVEVAYCFGDPVKSRPGRRVIPGRGPVVQKTKVNGHPCPRSIEHFKWLVNWWTDPGEVVLDPFAGSGTTGAACELMGRDAILIEKELEYANIARRILDDAKNQPLLFQEEQ